MEYIAHSLRLAVVAGLLACALSSPALAAPLPAAAPAPVQPVCAEALQSLKSQWNVVDYPQVKRPTDTTITGRFGHQNSASQIAYMQDQMQKAENDCHTGNQQAALQRIGSVQDMLDSHGDVKETANAAMIQR